jgi:hypothetical protein
MIFTYEPFFLVGPDIDEDDPEQETERTADKYENEGEETESNPDPGSPPSFDL